MANRSPPIPQPVGSIRPRAALAAMAASIALPPRCSVSSAIWVASGWLVAAMPWRAITSDCGWRNGRPVMRSPPSAVLPMIHTPTTIAMYLPYVL
jgi:hypothetical protein